ncbi:DUF4097 domain-containing protein [Cohnella sp. GCM10027633]|uniref:DUF4097 family beta strand repeat-containing protein n=1 Tax=unclassified Cohnella TaxID=2636738 RepID=UPI0036347DCD
MFRKKKTLLLLLVAALFCLMIAEIWKGKEKPFETFLRPFVNVEKSDKYAQRQRETVAKTDKELAIPRGDFSEVSLSGTGGRISVGRSADAEVRLRYTIAAHAAGEATAVRKRDAIRVEQAAESGRLTLKATANGKRPDSDDIVIDYELLVPDGMNVRIDSENATVRVEGTVGDAAVSGVAELVEIVGVQGDVSATSDYGNVYISGITGNVTLVNLAADANVTDIRGNVAIDNESGRNFVGRVEGKVSGVTHGGPVYAREIDGSVELDSRNADLQLEDVRGDVRVEAVNGKTTLILPADAGYALNAYTNGGRFRTTLPIPVESAGKGEYALRGIVGDGKWRAEVTSRSGNIVIYTNEEHNGRVTP